MSRRSILALSATLSAFVLVLVGAAASYGLRGTPATARAPDSVPAEVVRAREAELRRQVDDANAQLRAQQAVPRSAAAAIAPSEGATLDDPTLEPARGDQGATRAREGRHERRERNEHRERHEHHDSEDDDG
jgi:hypothetical protein